MFSKFTNLTNKLREQKSGKLKGTKILLLGDEKVGKTTLFTKFSKGNFIDKYKATTTSNYFVKKINYQLNDYNLQLWDTPGNNKNHQSKGLYENAACIIVMFNTNNKDSFNNAFDKWIPEFFNQNSQGFPLVVLGNKFGNEKAVTPDDLITKLDGIKNYTTKFMYKEIFLKKENEYNTFMEKVIEFLVKNNAMNEDLLNEDSKIDVNNKNKSSSKKFMIKSLQSKFYITENNKEKYKTKFSLTKNRQNFDIILLGNKKVGKTSILSILNKGKFNENYNQTTNESELKTELFLTSNNIHDFYLIHENQKHKTNNSSYEEDTIINLNIIDMPGKEDKIDNILNKKYYCCGLVFDLTNISSLKALTSIKDSFIENLNKENKDIKDYNKILEHFPFILIGNKCDLESEIKITDTEIESFLTDNPYIRTFKCVSAKNQEGIYEVFEEMSMYAYDFYIKEKDIINKEQNINKNTKTLNILDSDSENNLSDFEKEQRNVKIFKFLINTQEDDFSFIYKKDKNKNLQEEKIEDILYKSTKISLTNNIENNNINYLNKNEYKIVQEKNMNILTESKNNGDIIKNEENKENELEQKILDNDKSQVVQDNNKENNENSTQNETEIALRQQIRELEDKVKVLEDLNKVCLELANKNKTNNQISENKKEQTKDNDNIKLYFELNKNFLDKNGNKMKFEIIVNKNEKFIQVINSLHKQYPFLNNLIIKAFGYNNEPKKLINYYKTINENSIKNDAIIIIKNE